MTRPIHITTLDKARPVLVLTRSLMRSRLTWVTVAPITSTIRGIPTEILVGPENGLAQLSVVTCDNITTIRAESLGRQIGQLRSEQEALLTAAVLHAYDLEFL